MALPFLAPFLLAASLLPQDPAPPQAALPLLEQQKLRQAMARLASEHADLVSVHALGFSRGAPDADPLRIEALRLAAGELGQGRPAVLVVANLEGPMVYTSALALDVARRLAEDYAAGDAATRALLDATTLYLVPRANPDGAAARFASPLSERRGTGHGVDDDRDGASGEDAPQDVDGDGVVAWLRVPDPEGGWRADPTDARVLVKADRTKGEAGEWRLVREGRDADGDGEASEDSPRDAQVDRNFPAGFEEHSARAGLYPTDEPEARALTEFVLAHPDVQMVVVYGERDDLLTEPRAVADDAPDSDRVPAAGWRRSDADRLKDLARAYRDLVGKDAKAGDAEPDDAGTFQRWCYEQRGLFAFGVRPWSIPFDEKKAEKKADGEAPPAADDGAAPEPSDDARRLRWLEEHGIANAHLGWKPLQHPELGAVEVGGFRPYALLEPPADRWADLVDAQRAFLVGLSGRLARVDLVEVTGRDLGAGLLEVRATVENHGYLPLLSTWGARTRTVRPARVLLHAPDNAQLLAGRRMTLVDELAGVDGRRELVWLVRGVPRAALGVSVETDHAGRAQVQPEWKE